MPMDTVRLIDSDFAALSTGEEFKAGVMLWCKAWQQLPGGSLPNDDRVLAHLSGTGARWKKIRAMALHGFVLCSDGRLYHPVIAEKAREAWKHRQSQRARAARRWHMPRHDDSDATADATADAPAMQGTGTGTVNQEQEHSVASAVPPDQSLPVAGAVCARLKREAKCIRVNPSDPHLLAALSAGVSPDLIVAVGKEYPTKPLAYIASTALGRHNDAASMAAGARHGQPGQHPQRVTRLDRIRIANGLPPASSQVGGAGGRDAGRTIEGHAEEA